jgi:hypothetical protein
MNCPARSILTIKPLDNYENCKDSTNIRFTDRSFEIDVQILKVDHYAKFTIFIYGN